VTARPYYLDLRERVESGETVRAVEPCSELCVSGRAAASRRAKWADTGALFLAKERDWVLARIEESPTITLRGLQAELAERGVAISYGAVWASSMATARVSKKTVRPSEQHRARVQRRREQWKKYQGRIDPARFVFINETWVKTNMARVRGWCDKGKRLRAHAPYGHWKTLTSVAALRPLSVRRSDQCKKLSCLCPPLARSGFEAGPRRDPRQSLKPQRQSRSGAHPWGRPQAAVLAALLARSQPDRASLREAESALEESCAKRHGLDNRKPWRNPEMLHTTGMRQLPQKRWICFGLSRSRSKPQQTQRISFLVIAGLDRSGKHILALSRASSTKRIRRLSSRAMKNS